MSVVRQTITTSARQHGAMEYAEPPADLDAVRRYRLARVRDQLRQADLAGALLYDQLNTRYATDATNMQIWCMHNETRYVFVPTEGPVILFEYGHCAHLAQGIPTIDEVRPTKPWFYFSAGPNWEARAQGWAAEIADLVHQYGGGNNRLAVDRVHYHGLKLLEGHGLEICDAWALMETAREIKSAGEIALMRHAVGVCEAGMHAMRDALRPGLTENALLSKLHEANITGGGEWMETRLLSSGPRTNPWFRESSLRQIEKGDMVSFDTDLIGPYGYCVDISRSWICGDGPPSSEQSTLHTLAVEQIESNKALIKPGASYREISENAWKIPPQYAGNRYGSLMHGVGLCDESPSIKHWEDFEAKGYDGHIEPGMVMCVESYLGAEGGREGVKLEEQVLVTEEGIESLSTYPLGLTP